MTETILFEDQFDGQWYATDWGQLPEGWDGWWFDNKNRPPDKGWLEHRPEYGFPDPNHANANKQVLSAPHSVQYGKLWATVWAGITRQYEGDIQGKLLEFGIWGYVLAGGSNQDDPTRPGLMYDMVGIDPLGGSSGLSDSIIWGEPLENLVRGFGSDPNWKLYTVRARATNNYVSVFTHFHPEWPIEHLGPLFDNAYLKIIDGEEPESPLDYDRTYFLMNPLADTSNINAVSSGQWRYMRSTVGGSADDARLEAKRLKTNRVFAMNPGEWPGDLKEYIGVDSEYIPIEYSNNFQLEGMVLAYALKDRSVSLTFPSTNEQQHITQRFGRQNVTASGRIIHHNGLDIRSSWGIWKDEILAAIGGKVIVAGWNTSEPWYGEQVRIETLLPDGEKLLTRYAHLTDGNEYVQVGDTVGAGHAIGKPDDTGQSTADHLHFDVAVQGKSGVKYADPEILIDWGTIPEPPEPPEPPQPYPMPQYIAPHAQARHYEDGLREFILAQDDVRGMKFFHAQDCEWAFDVAASVGRSFWIQYRKYFNPQDLSSSPQEIAKYICDSYEGDIIAYGDKISSIEGFNEIMDSSVAGVNRTVAIEVECMLEVERRRWPVKFCGHNTGVGNPHESQVVLMLPMAQVAHEGGHLLGLHCYGGVYQNESYLVTDAPYHSMRFAEQDKVFVAHGYHVKWFLSEAGPIGAGPRHSSGYLPLWWDQGWRHPNCMDGDWLRCFDFFTQYSKMIHAWNEKNEMRVIAYSPFTTGAPWLSFEWFQYKNEELIYLANH